MGFRRSSFNPTYSSTPAGLDGLLVSAARDTLLGAVFGEVDPAAAQKLLDEAMQ